MADSLKDKRRDKSFPMLRDEAKNRLRSEIRNLRKQKSPEVRLQQSKKAATQFLHSPLNSFLKKGDLILYSQPWLEEIDLSPLLALLDQQGLMGAYPAKDHNGAWTEESPWVIGFGNRLDQSLEPLSEAELQNVRACFVPAVAIDGDLNRLGMGLGFYDRWLRKIPGAVRVSVCYEEQFVTAVPIDPWDEPVDLLVTPERIVISDRCEKKMNQHQ